MTDHNQHGEDESHGELQDLFDRHLRNEVTESEQAQLVEVLDSSPEARGQFVRFIQWETELSGFVRVNSHEAHDAQQAHQPAGIDQLLATSLESVSGGRTSDDKKTGGRLRSLRGLLVLAMGVIVALGVMLMRERTGRQNDIDAANEIHSPIARITGLSGALIWTGDRGQIVRDIAVGTQLAGGTIEGMAPDSWFELQFNDGSKVVISGTSLLTFADAGQKILRLREGNLSADVQPQPQNLPMLVHTRTALMQVLGTQFDVEAGLTSTALNVSEGKVRIRRLSDGREVDVPAEHLVVADDERKLIAERVPRFINAWKTDLHRKADNYGKWQPATVDRPALLKAIPLVPPDAPHVTLHLAGISVDRSDGSPVVIESGSRFLVKGRLQSDAAVHFGIRVAHPNGEFAGMFRGDLHGKQPIAGRNESGEFEEIYELANFTVDPAVWDKRDELAPHPDGLVLTGVWAFTHTQSPAGLELTAVELQPFEARP